MDVENEERREAVSRRRFGAAVASSAFLLVGCSRPYRIGDYVLVDFMQGKRELARRGRRAG